MLWGEQEIWFLIQLFPFNLYWLSGYNISNTFNQVLGAPSWTHTVYGIDHQVGLLPIPLGTADTLIHHIHAFTIHVTALILLKGVLFARGSRLIADKALLGFRFPWDGPGRGGTWQVSSWDHIFLGLFWMYNSISIVIFHFSWKMQSDVWGSISPSTGYD